MDKVTQILQEFASPEQVFWKTKWYPYFLLIWKHFFFATKHPHFPWTLFSHNYPEFLFANTTD